MINNATGYPPFEGPITSNPDTGTPFTVTIPFFGVRGLADDADVATAAALAPRDGDRRARTHEPDFKRLRVASRRAVRARGTAA